MSWAWRRGYTEIEGQAVARRISIIVDGFLDGFTGAGLFGKLARPGAPTEFVDSRSVDEFVRGGEYSAVVTSFDAAVVGDRKDGHLVSVASGVGDGVNRGSSQHVAKPMSGHR